MKPDSNLPRFASRFTAFACGVSLLIGAAIGAGLSYYAVSSASPVDTVVVEDHSAALLQAQLQVQTLETQRVLDLATLEGLQQRLAAQQNEVGQLQEQLAFYDHLLPLTGKGIMHIRALDVQPQDHLLKYRLLLQSAAGAAPFNGHITFTAAGHQNGDSVTITLYPAGNTSESSIPISFDRFSRTTGLLQMPEGFIPETVTVAISQDKQLRATHSIHLATSADANR